MIFIYLGIVSIVLGTIFINNTRNTFETIHACSIVDNFGVIMIIIGSFSNCHSKEIFKIIALIITLLLSSVINTCLISSKEILIKN